MKWHYLAALTLGLASFVACEAADHSRKKDRDHSGSTSSGDGGSGGSLFNPTTGQGGAGAGILTTEPPCDDSDPNVDGDGDGWTDAAGDCNDCTAQMNPGALDYPGNGIDEDCNGTDDDDPTECDAGLTIDSNDAVEAAHALDLCKMAQGEGYGLIEASYVNVDGSPANGTIEFHKGHGILDGFGAVVKPQRGARLFAISSGAARDVNDPGYEDPGGYDKQYMSGAAPGYPKESPSCPGVTTGAAHDSIALRMRIRTPTNALSLSFNVNMYTWEFPVYICSPYNDFITAMLSPTPSGQPDGNISFDAMGNSLSVNAGFLEVCSPQSAGGKTFDCNLGAGPLAGTGFEEHAATGWLQTSTTVENPGGEIVLELGAWDSGDGVLDTTGLFDNFKFSAEETPTVTVPVDVPK